MNIEIKKKLARNWFILLRNIILYEIESLEKEYSLKKKTKPKKFIVKNWEKSKNLDNGGGEYSILKNGSLFEKAGVNFSEVYGKFDKKFKNKIPGASKNPNFWASGISVVVHMKNPKIPALHFNTRFIQTKLNWFGGGMDMTPSINDLQEFKWFHKQLKKTCDNNNKKYYPKYKKWCDRYFYLNHRKEMRGVGGIFFDYKMNDWKKNFFFIRDVGNTFTYILKKIIKRKMYTKWTKKEKDIQLIKRGRYIEFNLLYDRGTKFGLETGGNTEAILMSLPPFAKWK